MKLYRAKIPFIAKEIVDRLATDGDIEVVSANREEAEKDLAAIMDEYRRRDMELRERVREYMSNRNIPYSEFGRTRKRIAEQMGHPMGDDVERFLARQFIENLLISPNIEEVYEEDQVMHRKVMEVLRTHDVDEREIREEAMSKIKNVQEGTVDYEIALQNAVKAEKKKRGLI
ncbi:MAG: DUF507 family protein [Myxococcales bacterium]|nr:DUF507 family protein [Myxococcales bacterium]